MGWGACQLGMAVCADCAHNPSIYTRHFHVHNSNGRSGCEESCSLRTTVSYRDHDSSTAPPPSAQQPQSAKYALRTVLGTHCPYGRSRSRVRFLVPRTTRCPSFSGIAPAVPGIQPLYRTAAPPAQKYRKFNYSTGWIRCSYTM